jgi:3-hydroxyisobutyrate dehydrogenase-like beta-hydroxyacid dehydrogenase
MYKYTEEQTTMQEIKVGVIGIGNMGSTHAKNIYKTKSPAQNSPPSATSTPKSLERQKKRCQMSESLRSTMIY